MGGRGERERGRREGGGWERGERRRPLTLGVTQLQLTGQCWKEKRQHVFPMCVRRQDGQVEEARRESIFCPLVPTNHIITPTIWDHGMKTCIRLYQKADTLCKGKTKVNFPHLHTHTHTTHTHHIQTPHTHTFAMHNTNNTTERIFKLNPHNTHTHTPHTHTHAHTHNAG